jgi:hypothetical protein
MSLPVTVEHVGVATARSCLDIFGCGPMDTSYTASYSAQCQNQQDIVGAIGANPPVVLELGNVAKVRILIARCVGNSVTLLLTSADGSLQAVPLSGGGLVQLFEPNVGDEITDIEVKGDGSTVSYYVAGDIS